MHAAAGNGDAQVVQHFPDSDIPVDAETDEPDTAEQESRADITVKFIIAGLGAIAGILANFIAVIYLKMHSETLKSLTEFDNRLVVTHHLHFANFLAAKVTTPEAREKVWATMAESITKGNSGG